jgi:hypothetical protein
MNNLYLENGIIYVVDVPEKKNEKAYAYKTAVYDDLLKKALLNKIESM